MHQTERSDQPDGPMEQPDSRASDCFSCPQRSACLANDLDASHLGKFSSHIRRSRTFQPGEHVFTEGESFRGIHIVKTGFFESYSVTRNGQMRVNGFHIAGDIFGLEGIGPGSHSYTTAALTTGTVCRIPLSLLRENSDVGSALIRRMLDLMSEIILRDRELIYSLATMNASQRIATFLVDLTTRMEQAGFRRGELVLHMHRIDIGNYLGLAEETVSRVFTRFNDQGIVSVKRRHIENYDLDGLRMAASGNDSS